MIKDGYGWFGDDAVTQVTVVPSGRVTNDAKVLRVTVPQYVAPGEKVKVSVSIRNTGTAAWTKA